MAHCRAHPRETASSAFSVVLGASKCKRHVKTVYKIISSPNLAKHFLDLLLDARDPTGAADNLDAVNVFLLQLSAEQTLF